MGFEVRGENVAVRLPLTGSFLSIVLTCLVKNGELLSCSDSTSDPWPFSWNVPLALPLCFS